MQRFASNRTRWMKEEPKIISQHGGPLTARIL